MLVKSWRIIKGEMLLYKSGTEDFTNSELEPYSEYYASQIAIVMYQSGRISYVYKYWYNMVILKLLKIFINNLLICWCLLIM